MIAPLVMGTKQKGKRRKGGIITTDLRELVDKSTNTEVCFFFAKGLLKERFGEKKRLNGKTPLYFKW